MRVILKGAFENKVNFMITWISKFKSFQIFKTSFLSDPQVHNFYKFVEVNKTKTHEKISSNIKCQKAKSIKPALFAFIHLPTAKCLTTPDVMDS